MNTPIYECVINKKTSTKPIWFMRQAGRYLPEFKEIRKLNPDFVNLCLNHDLSSEITLQPLKRFDLDAAIIFSDILMIPYALTQKVNFKKNFGPELGNFNLKKISKISELDFVNKLEPIYKSINKVKKNPLIKPNKVPREALKATFKLLLSFNISPAKAPNKGPSNIPKGPKKTIPNINPKLAPITPFFEPPNNLVPIIGIM